MLEVKNLKKNFGDFPAVKGVSFSVKEGEVLGFLGPNGAGKSTTMRMITGFLPPSGGTAVINGHDIVSDPLAAKADLGYLPESAPSYRAMTVRDYLAFVAEVRGFGGAAGAKRVQLLAGRGVHVAQGGVAPVARDGALSHGVQALERVDVGVRVLQRHLGGELAYGLLVQCAVGPSPPLLGQGLPYGLSAEGCGDCHGVSADASAAPGCASAHAGAASHRDAGRSVHGSELGRPVTVSCPAP